MTAPAPTARKARALKPADNATAPATAKPPAKAGPKAGRKAKAGKNATRANVAARAGSGRGGSKGGTRAARKEHAQTAPGNIRHHQSSAQKHQVVQRDGTGGRRPPKPERLSALNAAVLVLASAPEEGLAVKEMVAMMVAQGLWSSPAGKTPEATLYAGICRDLPGDRPQGRPGPLPQGQQGSVRARRAGRLTRPPHPESLSPAPRRGFSFGPGLDRRPKTGAKSVFQAE